VLQVVSQLFEAVDKQGARFCHWKSNATLAAALDGKGDLDLLVLPVDVPKVESVLREVGFVEVAVPSWRSRPGARHFYGLDDGTGSLVHIDLYEQLVTGGTLLKNHHLPLEAFVLGSLRRQGSVPTPSRGAELALLVVRKMLECASLPEHALLMREYHQVECELKWLADESTRAGAIEFLRCSLPMVEPVLFEQCLRALATPSAVLARHRRGRQIERKLARFRLMPVRRAELVRWMRLARWALRRLRIGDAGMPRLGLGAIVAFVGPEGSGKSTHVHEISEWLRQAFAVRTLHVGKPTASLIGAIPNLLAPAFRRLMPTYRPTSVARAEHAVSHTSIGFWLYMWRCVGLAFDRWLLLTSAARQRKRGVLIVCDRYPSMQTGFVDSPELQLETDRSIHAWLARLERSLYSSMPRADLVITCQVTLDEAIRRNTTRRKKGGPEPDDLVRYRHAQFRRATPSVFQRHVLDTAQPAERTRLAVRRLVWEALRTAASQAVLL
jgi:thymidylate kinase